LKDILAGQAIDPQIETDDVGLVPMSTGKYLMQRFTGTIGLGGVPTLGIQ
jgi:hypothetical protein